MTYTSTLILEVSEDLHDQALGDEYARWSQADLLKYLNAGERQIVYFKPTTYVITAVYQLAEGIPQNLPDGSTDYYGPDENPINPTALAQAVELIKVTRNMGNDGRTEGETIYPVRPQDMEEMYPGWRSVTADATVLNYMYEPQCRTSFEVYPPVPASPSVWIEAQYSAVPAEISAPAGNYDVDINLGDEYLEPIKNYMKYRAHAKDAGNSQFAKQESVAYWNLFLSQIGRKDLIEKQYRGQYGNGNQ
jgi:hypothetical protein